MCLLPFTIRSLVISWILPHAEAIDNRMCAMNSIGGLKRHQNVPPDLVKEIIAYSNFNDWTRFTQIFENTTTTKPILEWAAQYMESKLAIPGQYAFPNAGWGPCKVKVDSNRNIIHLCIDSRFKPYYQKLTDSDIKDLSKMPPHLQSLDLSFNALTNINVSKLPQGLRSLSLCGNQISEFQWNVLPPKLERLELLLNKLTTASVRNVLPLGLRSLILSRNELVHVDLSGLPPHLRKLSLDNNRLNHLDLCILPSELIILQIRHNPFEKNLSAILVPFNGFPPRLQVDIPLRGLRDGEMTGREEIRREEMFWRYVNTFRDGKKRI